MNVNTNYMAMTTQNYMRQSSAKLETSMTRLSSGMRINSASDDAAGLAISSRMESKIRGMEVGIRNSNDGKSLVQTAESALGSVGNIMQRMRELAVQASNGTNTATDLASLNKEYGQLTKEIDHIADNTQFNGVQLLNDTSGVPIQIQLSDKSADTMDIKLKDVTTGTGLSLSTDLVTDAQAAIGELDAAITSVSDQRAEYGANLNRLNFNIDNITSMKNNLSQAKSRIADADMAKESSEMMKNKILTQSGISMLSQANQNPQQVLSLLR